MVRQVALAFIFCVFTLCSSAATREYKVSNPYPFTACGYKVSGWAVVLNEFGEEQIIEGNTIELMPGESGVITIDIPDHLTFFSIHFNAVAHGSSIEFNNLGMTFEMREKSCLETSNAATFWMPLGNDEFNIWEGLITDVRIETVKQD